MSGPLVDCMACQAAQVRPPKKARWRMEFQDENGKSVAVAFFCNKHKSEAERDSTGDYMKVLKSSRV